MESITYELIYCLASGALAMVNGAAASLLVPGTPAKVGLWLGTSTLVSVAAGVIYRRGPEWPGRL